MTARAISSSTLSFGLLSIPVKIFSSTDSTKELHFNHLHKGCGSRVKQRFECEKDGELLTGDELVKGYEVAKGEYVTFTKEEIDALEAPASEAIEMLEFVDADSVALRWVEKTYYLTPDKGGAKGYELLRAALWKTGRVAIAKYSLRGKEHLVAVSALEGALALDLLYWADEVRDVAELTIERPSAPPSLAELELAIKLVDVNAVAFDPRKYADETRARIEDAAEKKVKGQEVKLGAKEPKKASAVVIDLMEVLKASIAKKSPAAIAEPAKKTRRSSAGKKKGRGR